jgi:hypothetical protein
MRAHKHQAVTNAPARALLSDKPLAIEFCECGCFRLNGSARWTRPLDPDFYAGRSRNIFARLAQDDHAQCKAASRQARGGLPHRVF